MASEGRDPIVNKAREDECTGVEMARIGVETRFKGHGKEDDGQRQPRAEDGYADRTKMRGEKRKRTEAGEGIENK